MAARDNTPSPQVNPTVPVGPLKTGPVGIDNAGNVWTIPMSGPPVFVANIGTPIPGATETPAD